MTETALRQIAASSRDCRRGLFLVVGAVFGLLWLVGMSYRQVYVARVDDVTALADGLLLVPGARWEDWFTQGHSHFFDAYPEWPRELTAFSRPAFQFLIYLAHFVFGREWSSYLAINYLGIAGVAAVAFVLARSVLRLSIGVALLATALVLLAPAVLEYSIWQLGFASEPLASMLVGGAFLAVLARRDFLCVSFLLVAIFTKETAAWAPFAAALTVALRPDSASMFRRSLAAAAMLLPIVLWLGFRFLFYGGIGGTYATASFLPLAGFIKLTNWKLVHLAQLFVIQDASITGASWPAADKAFKILTAVLVTSLLLLWAMSVGREVTRRLGSAVRERRWLAADAGMLLMLWAVLGLAFHFVLPVSNPVYATSAVLFAWPAVVSEAWRVGRKGRGILRAALGFCLVLSLAQMLHFLAGISLPPLRPYMDTNHRAATEMDALLRSTPAGISTIFVISSARSLAPANPVYLRAFLGLSAQIVHLIDVDWNCEAEGKRVAFDYAVADAVVTLSATLPDCANFEFDYASVGRAALSGDRIRRNSSLSYELPDVRPVERNHPWESELSLGGRLIARVRPDGRARFVIERGGPGGGLAWFDTP